MFGKGNAKIISNLIQENADLKKEMQKYYEIIAAMRGTIITYSIETENAPGLVPVYRVDLERHFITNEFRGDPRGIQLPAGWLEIKSNWIQVMRKYWGGLEDMTAELDGDEISEKLQPRGNEAENWLKMQNGEGESSIWDSAEAL